LNQTAPQSLLPPTPARRGVQSLEGTPGKLDVPAGNTWPGTVAGLLRITAGTP
jgi:hypothetical protein